MATVATGRGELAEAQSLYETALARNKQLENAVGISRVTAGLGELARAGSTRRRGRITPRRSNLCLIGLGGVYISTGESMFGVKLIAAAHAYLDKIGYKLEPADHAEYERYLALAREQAEPAALRAAEETGRALTLEQAIALV